MSKTYSGFTAKTSERLLLDAGAFFKNFDAATDTFDTAVTAGKLIGATRGGGEFKAAPTIRRIEVDGVKGAAKGLEAIDEWVVTLMANVLELSEDVLKLALVSADVDTTTNEDYNIISARNYFDLADYIENVTWVGKLSGSGKPVIIQVFNAINTNGLTAAMQDKNEGVVQMIFTGHYDQASLDSPPFKIFYPKAGSGA